MGKQPVCFLAGKRRHQIAPHLICCAAAFSRREVALYAMSIARSLLRCFVLLGILILSVAAAAPRVAIIGGGVGGTAAAYFLRQDNPSWQIELFERDCIGGRTREVTLDGKVLELGASIIHGANQYMLTLAREMGLTLSSGDDTGAAFSIWDGRDFVFAQTGNALRDLWAVAKRYGVTPLRYKWLSQEAGKRFGGIYKLQQQGTAFTTPEEWLKRLNIYNVTQQRAVNFMVDHLTHGWLSHGAELFVEELAGAINRINYNQNNTQLNALAGLVSYLPAADPEVYSIAEGNAALPNKLAQAAQLQGLHIGATVQSVSIDGSGHYTLAVQLPAPSTVPSGRTGASSTVKLSQQYTAGSGPDANSQQQQQQRRRPESEASSADVQNFGPYDAVIIATPLEGSRLELKDLDPQPQLPHRTYQRTTTSFVTGYVDAAYFDRATLADGDIFVTSSAKTPFTVVASKGTVSSAAVPEDPPFARCSPESTRSCRDPTQQQQQQQMPAGQHSADDKLPLWKVFSDEPLSWHTLRTLFVNGTVVASKSWAAYPRFQPPEKFAPFLLGPGLCYNNALENAASAMEVAAVAAKNCALLVQQHVQQQVAKMNQPKIAVV